MQLAELLRGVAAYREAQTRRGVEDGAYMRCVRALRGRTMLERAEASGDIVTFLNAWRCRLDRHKAPPLLRDWIRAHARELEALAPLSLADRGVPDRSRDIQALYESLFELRPQLRNMADAAASKFLHQLIPRLLVMWDKAIRRDAGVDYGEFIVAMHTRAVALLAETGLDERGLEALVQERVGSPVRKTLAKYIDEANVYASSSPSQPQRGITAPGGTTAPTGE
jgi:hypothetical protein